MRRKLYVVTRRNLSYPNWYEGEYAVLLGVDPEDYAATLKNLRTGEERLALGLEWAALVGEVDV